MIPKRNDFLETSLEIIGSSIVKKQGKRKQWVYGLKPEVWGRVVPNLRAELQVDPARGPAAQALEILHFVLHRPNRRTVIRLMHHIMANRDIICHRCRSNFRILNSKEFHTFEYQAARYEIPLNFNSLKPLNERKKNTL